MENNIKYGKGNIEIWNMKYENAYIPVLEKMQINA